MTTEANMTGIQDSAPPAKPLHRTISFRFTARNDGRITLDGATVDGLVASCREEIAEQLAEHGNVSDSALGYAAKLYKQHPALQTADVNSPAYNAALDKFVASVLKGAIRQTYRDSIAAYCEMLGLRAHIAPTTAHVVPRFDPPAEAVPMAPSEV